MSRSSALLEVLDPEQNKDFRDNYLDVPFDLSKVMFITTANTLDTIPPALRDRMEVLNLSGYTEAEKVHIAQKFLIPKQLGAHGLRADEITLAEDAIRVIVREYTREAGVRNLEREIASVMRRAVAELAVGKKVRKTVDIRRVRAALGKRRHYDDIAERIDRPGVATGLVWTPIGGEIIFVEAALTPGKGELKLTGQLGDVMKESASAALSFLKARAKEDRKSTRLNSSHVSISYAVFCLKKKITQTRSSCRGGASCGTRRCVSTLRKSQPSGSLQADRRRPA